MAHYLVQVSYTTEAWATMTRHPQNRLELVRPVVERLGGVIVFKAFAFGKHDLVAIVELPDAVSAAAFSMAVSAGGAVKAFRTTPLLSVEDAMKAMARAGTAGYVAPGPETGTAKRA